MPSPRAGGHEHRVGQQVAQAGELEVVGGVGLVDDEQLARHRAVLRADLDEHLAHRRDLLLRRSSEASTTCTSRSAVGRLLERRPEGLDELVRQVPDEADGVGEGVVAPVGGARRAAWWGRGWRTARPRPARPASVSAVEQLGLARVGVAGDRDGRHRVGPALRALGVAHLLIPPARAAACAMRLWMRRRSISILVSPGPREPMPAPAATRPPPCRDSAAPQPRSRGSR